MFDELKEVKKLQKKQISRLIIVKDFREITRLMSLQKTDAYLEPKRGSTVELFCE